MRRTTLEEILAARRESRILVRALDSETGQEQLIDPEHDQSPLGRIAADVAARDASRMIDLEGRRLFLSVYNAPWEIVIVGAVHIAQALAGLALASGYQVRVIDPRLPYATDERFPGINLVREWPDQALIDQPLTARSALIVLAHDPKLDDAGLSIALRSSAFYIGALGSARTHAKRLVRLAEAGFSQEERSRIHGPVGLSIAARSPAEIAIAILAEIIQIRCKPGQAKIAGLVLAAGSSSRMGHNKLTATVKDKPLIRHAVDAALAAGLHPTIVVTGHDAQAVRDVLAGLPLQFVQNDNYAEGLSASLRAGLQALPAEVDGAMMLLGDMPAITPELIARVRASFDPKAGRSICVATAADGTRGHPVLWGRQHFPDIAALSGDRGARSLMAAQELAIVEIDAGNHDPLIDLDTPEALRDYAGG
jgi:CTP:molybdopterin cytidylyltransferase MocA/xanthine/CO dehydrogenase XdhC/CoxF family maturation factor